MEAHGGCGARHRRALHLGGRHGAARARVRRNHRADPPCPGAGPRRCMTIILMYHSVANDDQAKLIEPRNRIAPRLFERQMAFLRESCRVVPLSRLVEDLVAGRSPAARTVCITFDDGYL